MVRLSKILTPAEIMSMLLTLSKEKHDIQKFKECIRSISEKRDCENKQNLLFCGYQQIKIHCVQVFKPTFHGTTIIFQ